MVRSPAPGACSQRPLERRRLAGGLAEPGDQDRGEGVGRDEALGGGALGAGATEAAAATGGGGEGEACEEGEESGRRDGGRWAAHASLLAW